MRNILLVGAASSMGEIIIKEYIDRGDNVIATYNNKCISELIKVKLVHLNLNDNRTIEEVISYIDTLQIKLDIVIFLSGMLPGKKLADYTDDEIEQVMNVNFSSQAMIIKYLLPYLSSNSHILMMSSISAQKGSFDPIYAASKAAIIGFVKSLATGLAPNTRINAIAPGLIEDSVMYNDMSVERQEFHRNNNPLKRLIKPDDIGKIIVDLTSEHWSNINGSCIDVNGGQYVR